MKNIKLYEEFNSNAGEYSLDEMDSFIREIIDTIEWSTEDTPRWKKTTIGFPGEGHGTGSPQATTKDDAVDYWLAAVKRYSTETNAVWYVWNAEIGGSFNKPKKFSSQRYDIQSILDIVKKYPDALRKMNISIDSDESRSFGKFMKDEYYSGKPGSNTGD